MPFVDAPTDWFHSEQTNDILKTIGFNSESTFVNKISFVFIICWVFLIHMICKWIYKCMTLEDKSKAGRWFKTKILDTIKYSIYLRLFIEAHQWMFLSSSLEIELFKTDSTSLVISLILGWIFFAISFSLPFIAFYYTWKKRSNYNPKVKFIFMEFFTDIKNSKYARIYTPLRLSRILFFVSMIVFAKSAPREVIYSSLFRKLNFMNKNNPF